MKKFLKKIRNWIIFFVLIYLFSWFLKGVFISVYIVPSGSMSPTIYKGDYVFVVKFPYRWRSPEYYPLLSTPFPFFSFRGPTKVERGDVLVFDSPIETNLHPSERETMVKRVVGFPGDTLRIKDEVIILPKEGLNVNINKDNKNKWEKMIQRDGVIDPNCNIITNDTGSNHYTFEQNFYFMIGDDRNNSRDSRAWGAVPEDHLIGKVLFTIWSSQTDQNFKKVKSDTLDFEVE